MHSSSCRSCQAGCPAPALPLLACIFIAQTKRPCGCCKCRPIGGKICRSPCSMSHTAYKHDAVVGFQPRSLKPMLALAMTPSAPSIAVLLTGLCFAAFVACGCDVLAPTIPCLAFSLDVSQTLLSNTVCRSVGVPWWHFGG